MLSTPWEFAQPPFEAQPDSRFFWPTPRHDEALAALSYAACGGGECVLLTGPTGCGKTLLLRALRRRLPREQHHVIFVPEAGGGSIGLLRRMAFHATQQAAPDSAAATELILQKLRSAGSASHIVIMLDDWLPEVPPEHYSGLRWLLTLELEERAVSVLLAGEGVQPARFWPGWLHQRLLANVAVGPIEPNQIPLYLAHRLRVAAGPEETPGDGPQLFTPAAAEAIAEWSGGVPRLINRLAKLALHVGALEQATEISAAAVARAVARLADMPVAVGAASDGER